MEMDTALHTIKQEHDEEELDIYNHQYSDHQEQDGEPGEIVGVSAQVLDDEAYEEVEEDPSELLEINHEDIEEVDEEEEGVEQEADAPQNQILKRALTQQYASSDNFGPKLPRIMDKNPNYPIMDMEGSISQMESRSQNQVINSKPTQECPICGDRANGIHYGIYSCEACKNFFKRSQAMKNLNRSYLCRDNYNCDVTLFEEDGRTRKRSRCQYCRYQACLNAGMTYTGQRGRRFAKPLIPQSLPLTMNEDKPERANNGLIAADSDFLTSFKSEPGHSFEEVKGDSDELEQSREDLLYQRELDQHEIFRLKQEIEILKSQAKEYTTSIAEKSKQLQLQETQIKSLMKECEMRQNHRIQNTQGYTSPQNAKSSSRGSANHNTCQSGM